MKPKVQEIWPAVRWRKFVMLASVAGLVLAVAWMTVAAAQEPDSEVAAVDLSGSQKYASVHTVAAHEQFAYVIRVHNGGQELAPVSVTDALPAEVEYVAGSATPPAAYDEATRTLSWDGVSVPARGAVLLVFAVVANEVPQPTEVINSATIQAGEIVVERAVAVQIVPERPNPMPGQVGAHKEASRRFVPSGERLGYAIRLHNGSRFPATLDVTDPLPAEVEYVAGSASHGAAYDDATRTLVWSGIYVPPMSDLVLSFAVIAGQVAVPTEVVNTATIDVGGMSVPRSAWVLIVPEAPTPPPRLIAARKTASRQVVPVGEQFEYTIRLHNGGTDEVAADVTDPLPEEVEYVAGSATHGGAYDPATRTLAWTGVPIPAQGEVHLTFSVTAGDQSAPKLVTNVATIRAGELVWQRSAWVLVVPEGIEPGPMLGGSVKVASRHSVVSGAELDYTIRLHNSGAGEAAVEVVDPLPPEVEYVAASASPAADYDEASRTLTWSGLTVPVHGELLLSFSVTANTVEVLTVVVNTADIRVGDQTWQRSARVVVHPEPPPQDRQAPVVESLTIDEQDILAGRDVTLHISATDDMEVKRMLLREWAWSGLPWPHWEMVQTTDWIPFQADFPWTLTEQSGVHFIGVWVADEEGHRSHMGWRALDFASLVQPAASVPAAGLVPYMVYYSAGTTVRATVTPLSGEADLYVWYARAPGTPVAEAVQEISFVTEQQGIYLFMVRGEPGAIYDLSIEPAGGPRPLLPEPESVGGAAQAVASGIAGDLIALMGQSGFDPLDGAGEPRIGTMVYLPLVRR